MADNESADILVSVVMPCYNVEEFVGEAIESVLDQTLANLELICVNDGSKDGTLDILKSYAEKDSRVVIIDKPNGGYGHSMNRGMEIARGKYIGIVESDDFIQRDMYRRLAELMEEHDLDFVRSDFYKFAKTEGDKLEVWLEYVDPSLKYYGRVLNPAEDLKLFNLQMLNWTGLYRTSFIRENNIRHNESPGASYQDNGFWFQTYIHATRVYYENTPYYCYRQDNMSSSINQTDKVTAMPREYEWIRGVLAEDPEKERQFIGVYHYEKMHNYNFALSILHYRFWEMFLELYSREYREARESGELDLGLFNRVERKYIETIMDKPQELLDRMNESRLARAKAKEAGTVAMFAFHLKFDGFSTTAPMVYRKIFHKDARAGVRRVTKEEFMEG